MLIALAIGAAVCGGWRRLAAGNAAAGRDLFTEAVRAMPCRRLQAPGPPIELLPPRGDGAGRPLVESPAGHGRRARQSGFEWPQISEREMADLTFLQAEASATRARFPGPAPRAEKGAASSATA
jgi:hypothetical protein